MIKKYITFVFSILFSLSFFTTNLFADYSHIRDNVGVIASENVEYVQDLINDLIELYDYHVTIVTIQTNTQDDYINYVNGFSEFDYSTNGVVLFQGFDGNSESYGYKAISHGVDIDGVTDNIIEFVNNPPYSDLKSDAFIQLFLMDITLKFQTLDNPITPMELNVLDSAILFSDDDINILNNRIDEIESNYDYTITMLTMNSLPNGYYELVDFCEDFIINTQKKGVVFAINMDPHNRGYATAAGDNGAISSAIFTSNALDAIDENIKPLLSNGQYIEAYDGFLDYTIKFIEAYENGIEYKAPAKTSEILIWVIVGPIVIALIIAFAVMYGVLVPQMKTAVIQTQARNFMVKDSFDLNTQIDDYLYNRVTKSPKPKPSSRSGGGGRSGGSRGGSF